MCAFNPELAEIRFGCGLSPSIPPTASVDAMLAGIIAPDTMADRFPIEPFSKFRDRMVASDKLRRTLRDNRGKPQAKVAQKRRNLLKKEARIDMTRWLGMSMLRRTYTDTAFFERLVYFWGDHFSATGKAGVIKRATSPYIEDGIRPYVGGRFSDLLISAVTHPVMLQYLDQDRSIGPQSERALKSGKAAGLNENLAREVMELHTLGVDGPYTQQDVRELAELFAGLSFQPNQGRKFRKDYVEPGAETVLGVTYDDAYSIKPVHAVLEDLAVHPATARHLSWKLAVHFVSDRPDPALIDHLTARYVETGGDLMQVYAALLEHPAAWTPEGANIKPPVEFVGSAMRALAVEPIVVTGMTEKGVRNVILTPMAVMGQTWQKFSGPDGWPEEDSAWLTPQGLSGRVRWAMEGPQLLRPDLPDPRAFVDTALGSFAPEDVKFAASAAESKSEAIGLVLMSPAFQRR
ncbi:DUF1800 domain-containing protein [Sulfitobacter sp. DFL-23]|uniref:DUF1800 domain-containing protein n=2 Tax=Pseudosulfitobacter pseudonitzschiae TaxID=1402135 RepID=A0A221JVV4_9RHOB|nr:DUF1800 domain-containing protein [Sulfitobacter sp. DFL-23]ASM70875.1 hypothetical protein SULPSESMR1_00034 [Pseudosulfitobacter pseudonitzschiae]